GAVALLVDDHAERRAVDGVVGGDRRFPAAGRAPAQRAVTVAHVDVPGGEPVDVDERPVQELHVVDVAAVRSTGVEQREPAGAAGAKYTERARASCFAFSMRVLAAPSVARGARTRQAGGPAFSAPQRERYSSVSLADVR